MRGLHCFGILPGESVAAYLPKQFQTVIGMLGAAYAGEECGGNEVGELVDRGALFSMGYWRAQLPNFMLPRAALFEDALLRDQNGKLNRADLKQRFHDFFQEKK